VLWELQRKRFEENRGTRKLCHLNPFEFFDPTGFLRHFALVYCVRKTLNKSRIRCESAPHIKTSGKWPKR